MGKVTPTEFPFFSFLAMMLHSSTTLPAQIQPVHLRPLAYRTLSKKYGLNIKSDGLAALAKFIGERFGIDWKKNSETVKFLELFAQVWKQQERGLFVDGQGTKEVLAEIQEREKEKISTQRASSGGGKGNGVAVGAPNHGGSKQSGLDRFFTKSTGLQPPHRLAIDEAERVDTSGSLSGHHEESGTGTTDQDTYPDDDNNTIRDSIDSNAVKTGDDSHMEGIEEHGAETETEGEEKEEDDRLDWRDYFKIINATDPQKFTYDPVKKQFIFNPSASEDKLTRHSMDIRLPKVMSQANLFPTRYYLTRDRLLRNEAFQNDDMFNPLSSMISLQKELANNGVSADPTGSYMSITQIKNLLGRDGKNFLLLGLLVKSNTGNWALEDPSGSVELDISQAIPTTGLYFVPGCILLVEGIYFTVGNKFHVTSITHPPGERREVTLDTIGNLDFLGIRGNSSQNYVAKLDTEFKVRLHFLERELEDHRIVILGGDIFLDKLSTFDALKRVLIRLNDDPPIAIVFMGSFTSVPVHASTSSRTVSYSSQYKNNFDTLASFLSKFENIVNNTTLIFVPGVNDPWSSLNGLGSAGLLPQRPIPSYFTKRMNAVCKHIKWGSNPTRIAYLSQEIVLFRDDLEARLRRHSVSFPMLGEERQQRLLELEGKLQELDVDDKTKEIDKLVRSENQLPIEVQQSRKYVKTLIDQGHLSPFLTNVRPIIWDLDYSLTLHPIPSTLIICDSTIPKFDVTYNGCKVINPGRFMVKRRAAYLTFKPSLRKSISEEVYF